MKPAWFNTRKAAQVVAYFAKAQGGEINVLKLMKLVYLSDREALKLFDAPILADKFVSMEHGPVNSFTYDFVNGTADENDDWNEFVTDRAGHDVGLPNNNISVQDLDELSVAELKVLALIWARFGHMDRYELRDYTHKHCPEWEDPNGSSAIIPLARIFNYLEKHDGLALAAKLESERIMDEIFAALSSSVSPLAPRNA